MPQTITQLLIHANKHIDAHDAEIILSYVINKPKEYIVSHGEDNVSFFNCLKYKKLVKLKKNNVPTAYITGYKEFFGLDFEVNKYTLVPRPDTEILVESVLKEIKENDVLIDIGTGSGCIPISILKNKKNECYATDISVPAIKIAQKNAKKHGVVINFLQGDLLSPVANKIKEFDSVIITANLPYLTEHQFKSEKSIQKEPKTALVAKKDGLDLYEKLLNQIKKINKNNITIFLEIDPSQSEKITKLIKNIFPNPSIEIKKDLSNQDRTVIIQI